jgi:membrane fusion protein
MRNGVGGCGKRKSDSMHSSHKIYGAVSINLPAPYVGVITALSVVALLLILYGLNMDFTAMYVVKGYLNTEVGATKVFPMQSGVISRSFVTVGQEVDRGQNLFLINTTTNKTAFFSEEHLLKQRLTTIQHAIHRKTNYLHALQPLLTKHYVSESTYQAVRDQVIALETTQHELQMGLIHNHRGHDYMLRAPIHGVIANVSAYQGQQVGPNQALLTLLPHNTELVAQLYIPVAKSGFLQSGAAVTLRYDAYPYQHFGVASAQIETIAQSIMNDREEDKPLHVGQPYYKVLAHLDHQFMLIHGQKHALKQGMTCTAVLAGAHKKIWQWLFDPLYYGGGN